MKHYSFLQGMPTSPDVDLLIKSFPEIKIGDVIEYKTVAEIIGVPHKSSRFDSVTRAWRGRIENEKGLVIKCQIGVAFFVAMPEQITSCSNDVLQHIGKTAKKQRRHLLTIRSVDARISEVVEHQARLMHHVEMDVKSKRINILPNAHKTDLPKMTQPRVASVEK